MRVSTGSLDSGHDVCDAQAAGNWAEGRSVTSLCVSLISRRLLWQVLARIGVPQLVCDLMTTSARGLVRGGARTTARMHEFPAIV